MSGIKHLSQGIIADLGRRLPRRRKTQHEKPGLLVGTMPDVRSANLMDLAASLPRATGMWDCAHNAVPAENRPLQEAGKVRPNGGREQRPRDEPEASISRAPRSIQPTLAERPETDQRVILSRAFDASAVITACSVLPLPSFWTFFQNGTA